MSECWKPFNSMLQRYFPLCTLPTHLLQFSFGRTKKQNQKAESNYIRNLGTKTLSYTVKVKGNCIWAQEGLGGTIVQFIRASIYCALNTGIRQYAIVYGLPLILYHHQLQQTQPHIQQLSDTRTFLRWLIKDTKCYCT